MQNMSNLAGGAGDEMTVEKYQQDLIACVTACRMLTFIDIPDLLQRINRAESVGPFLDPTLYREKAKAMAQDKEILEAALPLWRLGKKLQTMIAKGAFAPSE